MTKLLQTLRMDGRRAFCSVNFLIAVLGMFLFLLINTGKEAAFAEDVVYLYTVSHIQAFSVFYVLIAALPYSASFCLDWNNQFLRPLLIRTGWQRYSISRVSVCALSGAGAVALGEVLYIIFFSLQYPLATPQSPFFENATHLAWGGLLVEGHYLAYFFCCILMKAIGAALFSVLALWISAYLPNTFVTLVSPIIAFYLLITLSYELHLPEWLDINAVILGTRSISSPLLSAPLVSMLYTLLCSALLCILLGYLFARRMKRRMGDG